MARTRTRNEDDDDTTDLDITSDDDTDTEDGDEDGDEGDEGDEDDGSDLGDGDEDEDEDGEEDGDDEGEEDADEDEADEDEADEDDLDPDDPDLAEIAGEDDEPPKAIPYARVVEMVEKARQEGAQGAKPAEPAPPAFDLKAKVAEKNKALLDGDEDKANELELEIEQHRLATAKAEAKAEIEASRAQVQVQKAVKHVMSKYPSLNDAKGNKNFDPEDLEAVVAMRDRYIQRGMPVASALLKAADRYFGKRGKTGDADGGKDGGKAAKPAGDDAQAKLRRLLKRGKSAKAQPPTPTGKRGSPNRGAAQIDYEALTEDDLTEDVIRHLEKNNPKLLAKLQGDLG